ncbi:hypothetical protein H5410_058093 [Solanum commersonii]|uniref:Uncharacterized protein n=1 Tax=Solanum commersonii TaxID=4109 RepID=A0A9J5WRU0_SOLCO|nr:hypothetical protein H5410_058093 [Solanum commersonii]
MAARKKCHASSSIDSVLVLGLLLTEAAVLKPSLKGLAPFSCFMFCSSGVRFGIFGGTVVGNCRSINWTDYESFHPAKHYVSHEKHSDNIKWSSSSLNKKALFNGQFSKMMEKTGTIVSV